MTEQLQRFINLLKGIFELDKSDLDFGIYRIMNIRKAEIERFLTEGLPRKVQEALAPFARNTGEIEKEIASIEKQCEEFGIEVMQSKKAERYAELKKQLALGVDLSGLEADVYSNLYSFFNRYYEEGDFISKRRYKEGVYAIPYEGEEVKLYWANQDQYYIKTSENFRDYTFVAGGYDIHFRLVDATTEQNNNKESADSKRVFMLFEENDEQPELKTFEFDAEKNELIIRFVFDVPPDKKFNYAEDNAKKIHSWIISDCNQLMTTLLVDVSKDPKKKQTLIEKHLAAYTAKNTFDYFIHKDLRGFLSRELDFYIKNEVIHLDDVDTADEKSADIWLAKVRAIKRVGRILIDFLAQIEDFQKKLWLKKKFVISTNWCITLDRIDEKFYPEIAANRAQVQEWIDLYAVNEITDNLTIIGFDVPPSIDFLKQNLYLLIDTKYFSNDFKERLIADIENLDTTTNGVMVKSDNYQALSLLSNRYCRSIDCVYIDPPYNTDASKIAYKNNYEHSSWLSLMCDRIIAGKYFLKNAGIQATAIDEYELKELYALLQDIFGRDNNAGLVAIRSNPSGRPREDGLALAHEYTIVSKNSSESKIAKIGRSDEQTLRYDKWDEQGRYEQRNFRREGSNSDRTDGLRQWYPIYVNKASLKLRVPEMTWNNLTELWELHEQPSIDEEVIYPITDEGIEKNWRWSWENVKKDYSQFYAIRQKSGLQIYYKFRPNEDGITPLTFWEDKKYSAVEYGTKLLKDILPNNPFKYPKSLYAVEDMLAILGLKNGVGCVLDYFAGSGTTGHAVIELNRNDGGSRRYLLIDMGEYFDSVTLARMKKVIYSNSWRAGKPQKRDSGVSQIMKYFEMESYEDALSNISLLPDEESNQMTMKFGDEYLIKYMLDLEAKGSILNLEAFRDPFDYQLNVTEKNETKRVTVDVVETFNYLIGLTVTHMSARKIFRATPDQEGEYEGAVKLALDDNGTYCFRQIEGKLPDGRRTLVIWRNVTDNLAESNAALDAYFTRNRINPADREYDVIYVNGDNNLENLRTDHESWKVRLIEIEFKQKMFEEA